MTELFSSIELEVDGETRAGYRLHRLELHNWGTFHQHVGRLELGGDNTLLTGDIGSGKSTLVDAVTTLLLPSQRISYNKAAGADTRERSLRSYVLGHYKSERNETSGTSRPIGLRDHRSYSVILGVFRNEGYDESVTLAQVFWMRDTSQGQPQRFFVTQDSELSVADDFSDFGSDLAVLRRRLRERGAHVEDTFPRYGQRVRRLLGIQSEQAMELFHQTVSMKSVGNLNDFVRHHMLEPADSAARISGLVAHFEDLTRAHDAVRRARDQLEALAPLLRHCDRHDQLTASITDLGAQREASRFLVTEHRLGLLEAEQLRLRHEIEASETRLAAGEAAFREATEEQGRLRLRREGLGGDRIGELERLIQAETQTRDARRETADKHAVELQRSDLAVVVDADSFRQRLREVDEQVATAQDAQVDWDNRFAELQVERNGFEEQSREVDAELTSLRQRRSNIPSDSVRIRQALCSALGLVEDDLPFAGELIQVRPEHTAWQGVAERLLHGFALSILVPSEHYPAASTWINEHHLNAKVVYYKVAERRVQHTIDRPGGLLLVDLLDVRDGNFADWVAHQLQSRAGYVCASSVQELQRERRAVTMAGQIKGSDGRHEKDDRHRIDDRRRYVLGWSNEEKIDALLESRSRLDEDLLTNREALGALAEERSRSAERRGVLERLSVYRDWTALDWQSSVTAISRLSEEKRQLERSTAELTAIIAELAAVDARVESADTIRNDARDLRGRLSGRVEDVELRIVRQRQVLDAAPDLETARVHYPALRTLVGDLPGATSVDLPPVEADCEPLQQLLSGALTSLIEKQRDGLERAAQRAVAAMKDFRRDFPEATTEMDDSILAAGEFRELSERLVSDDLPKFEAEFKRQLNINTINDLASFYAWLRRSAEQIHDRIDTINGSLSGIDYNEGRFIRLEANRTPNVEVKEFRDELRACTDDVVTGDADQYSEDRFLRVKRILERFSGREGFTEADRQWTTRVTDVRNWFTFAASERWRDSEVEWEHYTDSDGKSGGQKEKLAYTILAASLAYQFKLEWGVSRSRDFRFVVIDEAFGRGSDPSTRYALGLFRRLGLQLLIVTPLQKVHVIEPYVAAVGFVENRTGERSRVQTLTIEEYAARQALVQAEVAGSDRAR